MLLNRKDGKNRIDVYIAPLPKKEPTGKIYPKEREDEIKETANERQRRERHYAWRLLEYALRHSLGVGIEEVGLKKTGGKWTADTVEISLSHSGEGLAVALSRAPVGVDIEPVQKLDREGVARRFFTERELAAYLEADEAYREEAFLSIWTAKEAVFKSRGEGAFLPFSIDTADFTAYTDAVTIEGKAYILSAFSEMPSDVAVHYVNDFE